MCTAGAAYFSKACVQNGHAMETSHHGAPLSLLAALAKRTGANVLTSDMYPERHAIAATYGLTHPLDASSDVVAACKAATEGRGADVAFDDRRDRAHAPVRARHRVVDASRHGRHARQRGMVLEQLGADIRDERRNRNGLDGGY